jgi:DNA-binding NtrC family response regulator
MAPGDQSTTPTATMPHGSGIQILVVDDDADMRAWVKEELESEGFKVETASGGRAGALRVKQGGIDLVVSDVKMPDLDGLDLLREIREVDPSPFVIIVTGFGSIDTAIRAVKLGAHDYITKPFKIDQLLLSIDKALAERTLRNEVVRLREEVSRRDRLDNIVGRSAAMQEIFALVRRLSSSHANILITGESGTGKELVARALHAKSPRKLHPFVAVNCAAIPENLLESEIFGYARGAHSTANVDRQGLFVEANGGTLFLDEIAELPLPLQPKLLRVLQDGEVRPLGANRAVRVDVRVMAATNRDLERRLREGQFREDLYYRLNVIQIQLPPLRGRQEDILPLAEHFLARSVERSKKSVRGWRESAKQMLLAYHWPGNVRELENAVERAVALAEHELIGPEDLPHGMQERKSEDRLATAVAQGFTLDQLEREYIERVLEVEGGNKTRAAQRLGLDRKTLYRKLEEYAAGSPKQKP